MTGETRDADLLELQLQNRATWDTLEAATRQRDATLRYHGAFIALVPVLLGRVTPGQLLAVAASGLAFLAFVSVVTLGAVQALRLLQFRISAAERCSRYRLAADGPEPYFGYTLARDMPPLPCQRDPMGFVVASARLLVLLDTAASAVLGSIAGAYAVRGDAFDGDVLARALVLGVLLGVPAAIAARALIDRWLRQGEREVSDEVRDRLAAVGIPAAGQRAEARAATTCSSSHDK